MAKTTSKSKKPGKTTPNLERVGKIIEILGKLYPHVETALSHGNPFQLLVATILSAQCTDERVNKVTKELFARLVTPQDFVDVEMDRLKELIRSTGFYNNKAKNIKGMAEKLVKDYCGNVPDEMEPLLTLPGVARKTANVVLGSAFGKTRGIVVDTHVKRLSSRLGFTVQSNPDKIEKDLMEIIPKDKWIWFAHALIWHGRKVCNARKPDCVSCDLNRHCPSAFTFEAVKNKK